MGEFYNYELASLDIAVLSLNNIGKLTGYTVWGGKDREYGSEIVIDAHGNLYIAGETYSYGSGRGDVLLLKNPSIIQVYPPSVATKFSIWANMLGAICGILCWFIFYFHKNRRKIVLK